MNRVKPVPVHAGGRLPRARWQPAVSSLVLVGILAVGALLPSGRAGLAAQDPAPTGTWVTVSSLPVPREETASAVVDGRIYLMVGNVESTPTALVQVYDPVQDRWSDASPVPVAMHHTAAAVVDGKIYLVGGFIHPFGEREAVDTVWMYDPATDQWQARAPLPAPRGALAVATVDGLIYAFGGERNRPPGNNPPYLPVADAAVYDPQGDRWAELPPLRYPRDHLTASAVDGRIYVFGGRDRPTYDLRFNEVFEPATGTWNLGAPMITGRSGHTAAVLDGHIYAFGGEGNPLSPIGIYHQVEVYDPAADRWAELDPMPVPRHAVPAATVSDRIYLPGGSIRQGGQGTTLVDAFVPAAP